MPMADMPAWIHPEYGSYTLRPAYNAMTDFEALYENCLFELVKRKWLKLCTGWPLPRFQRLELVDGVSEENGFAPVQGALLTLPEKPKRAPDIDLDRLSESFEKNCCACLVLDGGHQLAISPFFEWELADFWEEGKYEAD